MLLSLSLEWLKLLIPLKTSDLKLLSIFVEFVIVSVATAVTEDIEETLAFTISETKLPVAFVPV